MTATIEGRLNGRGLRIGIVVGRFNDFVTERLLAGARHALERHEVEDDAVTVVWVPGSFELPIVAKKLATSGRFDAIVTIGAVIRGETPHFEAVAGQAASGVASVALETGVPIIFGVLTTETVDQAVQRAGAKSGNKGSEAAVAAIEMANVLRQISDHLDAG